MRNLRRIKFRQKAHDRLSFGIKQARNRGISFGWILSFSFQSTLKKHRDTPKTKCEVNNCLFFLFFPFPFTVCAPLPPSSSSSFFPSLPFDLGMYAPSDQLIVLITYQAAGAFFFDVLTFLVLGLPGGKKEKKRVEI